MSWLPDWITGYDSTNAARAREADAKIRAINQDKINSGYYTAAQAAAIQKDFSEEAFFFSTDEAARRSIDQQFVEGVAEGRDNVKGFVNGAVWQVLKSIPFVVWVALALFAAFYLGGLDVIRKQFNKLR